ncbi:MAG TPA: RNA 2',3'-cyclic phosphodiesterase [Flavisolibacter sp.]|nr:RNA 2',3'-cyclic phosphodiesterase [Flavisolibacter sp.]
MQMFFAAIVLPDSLNEKILAYKKWMQEKYGCRVALKSPAHITIVPPFWTEPANKEALQQDLQTISNDITSFRLQTDGFSAFKPRTIFVAVKENEDLRQVKKTSDNFLHQTNYGIKIETRPFHPHITIATRDLHKKDFAEAWPHFENKAFEETFEATGISLLKHNGRIWEVVFTSRFAG